MSDPRGVLRGEPPGEPLGVLAAELARELERDRPDRVGVPARETRGESVGVPPMASPSSFAFLKTSDHSIAACVLYPCTAIVISLVATVNTNSLPSALAQLNPK